MFYWKSGDVILRFPSSIRWGIRAWKSETATDRWILRLIGFGRRVASSSSFTSPSPTASLIGLGGGCRCWWVSVGSFMLFISIYPAREASYSICGVELVGIAPFLSRNVCSALPSRPEIPPGGTALIAPSQQNTQKRNSRRHRHAPADVYTLYIYFGVDMCHTSLTWDTSACGGNDTQPSGIRVFIEFRGLFYHFPATHFAELGSRLWKKAPRDRFSLNRQNYKSNLYKNGKHLLISFEIRAQSWAEKK